MDSLSGIFPTHSVLKCNKQIWRSLPCLFIYISSKEMAEKEVKGPEFQAMALGGNPRIQFKNHSASIAHKHKKRFSTMDSQSLSWICYWAFVVYACNKMWESISHHTILSMLFSVSVSYVCHPILNTEVIFQWNGSSGICGHPFLEPGLMIGGDERG